MKSFNERVYSVLRKIPKGRVATYKTVADRMGTKAYRAVGSACKKNPDAPTTPCHRVVKSDGSVGGFMGKEYDVKKERLLRAEGVEVFNRKVKNFEKIVW